jgi:hypothetical protein
MGWTGVEFQFPFLAEVADCLKSNLYTALNTHKTTENNSTDSHTANTTALKPGVL